MGVDLGVVGSVIAGVWWRGQLGGCMLDLRGTSELSRGVRVGVCVCQMSGVFSSWLSELNATHHCGSVMLSDPPEMRSKMSKAKEPDNMT